MKGTDIYPAQVPLMSKQGDRLAKRSGQMTKWDQTAITSVQLDGDPWKTRWTAMQMGDRPSLGDWMIDVADDPGTQAEQETEHNADEEESEENESHRHEDLRRAAISRSEKSAGLQLDRRKRLRAAKDVDFEALKQLLTQYLDEEEQEEYHQDGKTAPARDRATSTAMDAANTPAYNPNTTVGEALASIKSRFVDGRGDSSSQIHWVALREYLTHFDDKTPMRYVNLACVDAQLRHLEAKALN
jgi:hypothetical protein